MNEMIIKKNKKLNIISLTKNIRLIFKKMK